MLRLVTFLSSLVLTSALTTEELAAFKPRLANYTDINTGKKAVVNGTDNDDGSQTIYTNGIPSHNTWKFPSPETDNPNPIKENVFQMKIYSTPKMRPMNDPLRCLPMGTIGVATSGTIIDSWYPAEATCLDVMEFETLDICEGHPSPPPQNAYHYHSYSPCVQMPVCGEASTIWGVAIDGIPIYGPWDENGKQLTKADLDECGGKTDSKGRYKYHMTVDPNYSISCLRGEIRSDVGKRPDDFMCTCPYYDVPFKSRPPSFSKDAQICEFNTTTTSEPIVCKDNIEEIKKKYDIGYEWVYKDKEIKLAPCCPKGKDCGDSCKTEKGIKDICVQENRTVKYLTQVKKGNGTNSAACSIFVELLLMIALISISIL
jgi:hypothetical protein